MTAVSSVFLNVRRKPDTDGDGARLSIRRVCFPCDVVRIFAFHSGLSEILLILSRRSVLFLGSCF